MTIALPDADTPEATYEQQALQVLLTHDLDVDRDGEACMCGHPLTTPYSATTDEEYDQAVSQWTLGFATHQASTITGTIDPAGLIRRAAAQALRDAADAMRPAPPVEPTHEDALVIAYLLDRAERIDAGTEPAPTVPLPTPAHPSKAP